MEGATLIPLPVTPERWPPNPFFVHKLMWSHATAHCPNQAWKGEKSSIKLVSAEEMPTQGLAGPADLSQVRTCQPCFCPSQPGRCRALVLDIHAHYGKTWVLVHGQGKEARLLGMQWQDNTRIAPHPKHPAEPSLPGPKLASLAWERPLRRPVRAPGEGRRMQLLGGPQGPGETEPALKRQEVGHPAWEGFLRCQGLAWRHGPP